MATQKQLAPVVFEDCRIGFRNFAGKEGAMNKAGDRNFVIFLEPGDAEAMEADGWNVKYLKPREEEERPQAYLPVAVGFKGRPPRIVMVTSRGQNNLGEDEVNLLDWADIQKVDLIINPYAWDVSGKQGIKAYVKSLFVTINEDELEQKYSNVPDSAQNTVGFFDEN